MIKHGAMIRFAGQAFPPDTEVIELVNTRLVTLDPLGDLPELRVLRLHHTNPHSSPGGALLNLSVLRKCPNLTVIEMPQQNIRLLDGLAGHRNLHTIDMSSTHVADLNPLADLQCLAVLRLRHTQVTSLAPITSVSTLEELDIAHTAIDDITVLRELPALTSLDLRATHVTNLAPLEDMVALRRVVVQRLDLSPSAIDRLHKVRPDVEVIT